MNCSGVRFALVLSIVSLVWSTALLTNFSFALIGPEKLDHVFNDMAMRLLRLDMTSDPAAINFEAFVHDGKTYTYFGIFPALIRIPAVLLGAVNVPLARISCLLALWIVDFVTIRLTQVILADGPATGAARLMRLSTPLGVSFSGPVIYVLASAAIYHEAIFWGAAWTAVFNLIVVRRIPAGLRPGDYVLLALSAGFALLSRVTCGVTLYLCLTLLAIWPALRGGSIMAGIKIVGHTIRQTKWAIAVAVCFILIQAAVNYGRWGNVLTMVPFEQYQTWDPNFAARMVVITRHGGLDPARMPLAALHYALGLKVDALFPDFFNEHFFGIEGPRIFGVLCAPWMILCSLVGVIVTLLRSPRSELATPLLLGNGIGFLMVLAIFDLALRYTFEGWAFLSLSSAFGARWFMQRDGKFLVRMARVSAVATLLGVVVSHATLLRYKVNFSGTDPAVRYWLSGRIQPLLCPRATLTPNVRLTDFNPLVTPNCPPLW